MKTKKITYGQTKVTCKEVKRGNSTRIEVDLNDYYDECVNYPTLETECANNTSLLLNNFFKNLY